MIHPDEVRDRIERALPGARVEVGTFQGDDHFEAVVEAPQFRGKSRVEQHQMVYAALDGLIGGVMHALALKTRIPEPDSQEPPMQQARTLEEWTEQVRKEIAEHHIVVFAKGEKNAAMCGFSHRVMQIFNELGAPYEVRNIFSDPAIKPAVQAVTNWPTTPQVFVAGKFVGGCDIVTEMYQNGELKELIEQSRSEAS